MKILTQPEKAIAEAKKEKSLVKSIGTLVAVAVLLALAIGIAAPTIPSLAAMGTAASVAMFIVVLIGGLFLGWIVKVAITTLGGTGKYFEGLTVVSYSTLPISVGAVIAAIVFFLPVLGILIGFAVLVFFSVLGVAMMYRAIKDLFRTDMITAFVGVSVIVLGITIAIYCSVILGAGTLLQGIGTISG